MNAQTRSSLLREPRPSDADDVRITLEGAAWRCVWLRDGRRAEPFGPGFAHVAEAAAAAHMVREAWEASA